jgi:hypothetical protein
VLEPEVVDRCRVAMETSREAYALANKLVDALHEVAAGSALLDEVEDVRRRVRAIYYRDAEVFASARDSSDGTL